MRLWTIQWIDKATGRDRGFKAYRDERTYNIYWKYHCGMLDYFASIGLDGGRMEGRDPDGILLNEHGK